MPKVGLRLMVSGWTCLKLGDCGWCCTVRLKEQSEPSLSGVLLLVVCLFSCEIEPNVLPPTDKVVGIDVGLTTFATSVLGSRLLTRDFFRTEQKALANVQRRLSKEEKEHHSELSDVDQSPGCMSALNGGERTLLN